MNKTMVNITVSLISQEEKNLIEALCKKYDIKNYTINPDGSIDVMGDVSLNSKQLRHIPLKFNKVGGDFDCNNNRLGSLKGCPVIVGGNFNCSNNHLTSLEGCPRRVSGFVCNNNTQLTSLYGCPDSVLHTFNCGFNGLTSLEFSPTDFVDFLCYENDNLPSEINNTFIGYGTLSKESRVIFIKYQQYFNVWLPEFNLDGMNELIAEIKDGLR
jgi:hypothetical protein